MTRVPQWLAVAVLVCMLPACGNDKAASATSAAVIQTDPAYAAATAKWQQQRRAELLKPDGWTSLVGLHWLELKSHYIGSGGGSGIRLAKGPERMGLVQQDGERTWFTPERGAALTVDEMPLTRRIELKDESSDAPLVIGFDEGKGRLSLIQRGQRRALRIKHADAPSRLQFTRLQYWPAEPSWQVQGHFLPHPPGRTIAIADIVGTISETPNPGSVEFAKDGQTYRIEALAAADGGLFLILADRTSGHGSYPAGRFIDAPAPDSESKVLVDFNRAYNPPCAFTAFATCPLPPPENRIDLAITAGEKTYTPPSTAQ